MIGLLLIRPNIRNMKLMKPLEFFLLAIYCWHLSLIQGKLVLSYNSRTAMPSYLWYNRKTKNGKHNDNKDNDQEYQFPCELYAGHFANESKLIQCK